jgi:hypothetical protein
MRWRVCVGAVAVVASLAACGSSNLKAVAGQSTGPAPTHAAPRVAPVCPLNLTTALSAPSSASAVTGFAPGSPAGGVLCQYDLGIPADYSSGQLGRYVVLTAAALQSITHDVHALTPTNKVATCPPPESVEVLNLAYADESTISLSISCSMVWQGDIHAMLTEPLGQDAQALLAAARVEVGTTQPTVDLSPNLGGARSVVAAEQSGDRADASAAVVAAALEQVLAQGCRQTLDSHRLQDDLA